MMDRNRMAPTGCDSRRRIVPTNADVDHVTIVFKPTADGRVAWTVDVATLAPERLARRLNRLVQQWQEHPEQIRYVVGAPANARAVGERNAS